MYIRGQLLVVVYVDDIKVIGNQKDCEAFYHELAKYVKVDAGFACTGVIMMTEAMTRKLETPLRDCGVALPGLEAGGWYSKVAHTRGHTILLAFPQIK
jgi:hypothetical protein